MKALKKQRRFKMKYIIALGLMFVGGQAYSDSGIIKCQLKNLASVTYSNGKIKQKSYKEKAKSLSVFTDLITDKPKMLQPDKIDLVKLKQDNGVYWLASPLGKSALVIFIIDTKRKVLIQQRSADFMGLAFYGQTWMGKCF